MGNPAKRVLVSVDELQRKHAWLGFPYAVIKKFGDDEAGKHAALIAYYGFFSLFPLMLVFVAVLGFLLGSSSHLKSDVVNSVLARFPIIGKDLKFGSVKGSGLALDSELGIQTIISPRPRFAHA